MKHDRLSFIHSLLTVLHRLYYVYETTGTDNENENINSAPISDMHIIGIIDPKIAHFTTCTF